MRKNGIKLDGIELLGFLYNYSTDNNYLEKIKHIIQSNDLDEFDDVRIDHLSVSSDQLDII